MTTAQSKQKPKTEKVKPPERPPEKTPLGFKMAKVLGEIEKIQKTGHNPHFHYDYVTEDVLTEQIRPLLAKHGIALMFGATHCDDIGPGHVRVWCEFILMDCDGNTERTLCPGQGKDERNQDKALPKAMTMATKYWLYKTFLVSTGDDTERDDPAKVTAPPPPPPDTDLVTVKQRETLEKILNESVEGKVEYSTQLIDIVKKSLTTDGPVTEGSAKRLIVEAAKQKKAKKVNGGDEDAKQTPAAEPEKSDKELEF